jgi:hypothetical protein
VGQHNRLTWATCGFRKARQAATGEIDVALCLAPRGRLHASERLLGPVLDREQAVAGVQWPSGGQAVERGCQKGNRDEEP